MNMNTVTEPERIRTASRKILTVTPEDRKRYAIALGKTNISDKVIRTIKLINEGLDVNEAILLGTGNHNPSHDTIARFKRESENCLSLAGLDEIAGNVYKKAMLGEPIVGKYKDKDGNEKQNIMIPQFKHALTAAEGIKDRTEPVKQQQQGPSINLFIDKVQVNHFQTPDVVSHEPMDNDQIIECNDINELGEE